MLQTGTQVPHIAGVETDVIRVENVFGPGSGFLLSFEAPAISDVLIEEFTFIWDLYLEPGQTGRLPLWQNDIANVSVAEAYLDRDTQGSVVSTLEGLVPAGMGLWQPGRWMRVAHRVNKANESSALFIDGVKMLSDEELPAPGWFFSAATGGAGWMLSDFEGGVPGSRVYCANIAVTGGLMSDADIAQLGGSRGEGIFIDNPTNYCVANLNSTGLECSIRSSGPLSQATNDFTLHAIGSVPNSLGFFFFADAPGRFPMGDGFACVSPTRFIRQNWLSPVVSNAFGSASLQVDLSATPGLREPAVHRIGNPTYFQFWYRDSGGAGSGSNLSDGLQVQFYE